jgi:hypothetical protein
MTGSVNSAGDAPLATYDVKDPPEYAAAGRL